MRTSTLVSPLTWSLTSSIFGFFMSPERTGRKQRLKNQAALLKWWRNELFNDNFDYATQGKLSQKKYSHFHSTWCFLTSKFYFTIIYCNIWIFLAKKTKKYKKGKTRAITGLSPWSRVLCKNVSQFSMFLRKKLTKTYQNMVDNDFRITFEGSKATHFQK